ncbi:MAG: hypothetical protein JWQ01_420 [Massilia sp.]|nr:hypothetical protein [Massilia sp.]
MNLLKPGRRRRKTRGDYHQLEDRRPREREESLPPVAEMTVFRVSLGAAVLAARLL